MIDINLSDLDPGMLYDLERRVRTMFSVSMYVSITFDLESNLLVFSVYDSKPEWHSVCVGFGETLIEAVGKCGEQLAAAKEKQEENRG